MTYSSHIEASQLKLRESFYKFQLLHEIIDKAISWVLDSHFHIEDEGPYYYWTERQRR